MRGDDCVNIRLNRFQGTKRDVSKSGDQFINSKCVYSTNKASKYMKQKLTELKDIAKSTIIVGIVKRF